MGDMPDTAFSAEILWRVGPFEKLPEFLDGEYVFFGKFPILHAVVSAILNYITGNSIISVFILHNIIMLALAYLIFFRAAKYLPPNIRLVIIVFLSMNHTVAMVFPWYIRPRTELTMLLLAVAFLEDIQTKYKGFLFFLAGLTQPLVTLFCSGIFAVNSYMEGKGREGVAAVIGVSLASLFYLDLIMKTGLGYLGCASEVIGLITSLSFMTVILFLMIKNKNLAQWLCTVGMGILFLNGILFNVFGKIEYTLFVNVPILSADLCGVTISVVFVYSFIFILLRDKKEIGDKALAAMALISILNMIIVASFGMFAINGSLAEKYDALSGILDEVEGGHVATMEFLKDGGEYKMIMRDIYLSPISYLEQRNTTFVGTPLPPTYWAYSDKHLNIIANNLGGQECADSVGDA